MNDDSLDEDFDGLDPFRDFVRDEVREILLQHKEVACAALKLWLDEIEAFLSRRREWQDRQAQYMRELLLTQAER